MMRILKLTLILSTFLFSAGAVYSQSRPFTDAGNRKNDNPQAGLMRELGLSPDQLQRIRVIRGEVGRLKLQAAMNLRTTRQELDRAIYSEGVDEADIHKKIAAVAAAQAEVTKVNAIHELKVRQVLTPEQLTKFREFRKRFAERGRVRQAPRQRNLNRRQRRDTRNKNVQPPPPIR